MTGFSKPEPKGSRSKTLLLFPKEYLFCSRSTNISVKLSTKLTQNIKCKNNCYLPQYLPIFKPELQKMDN